MSTNESSTNGDVAGTPAPESGELSPDSLESVSGGTIGKPIFIKLPFPIETPPYYPIPIDPTPELL